MSFRSDTHTLQRIVANLVQGRDPILVLSRYVLVGVLVVSGLRWINAATISLEPEVTTHKDFLQDFLMGKAVVHGISPYLPTSDLAERFVGKLPHLVFAHPCPHPPPVALLLVPLALLDYQTATIIWFVFEILAIVAIVSLLSHYLKERQGWFERILIVLAAFAWHPFGQELVLGQLGALLLLLLVLAWRSLRAGSDLWAGIFLGLSLSIKLFTWPILLFYLIRRRWSVSVSALASFLLVNFLAVAVVGWQPVRFYFTGVSAKVFDAYKSAEPNLSLWTVGWRLFEGTGSSVLKGMHAHPLWDVPQLAPIVSVLVVAIVLVVGIVLALRACHVDTSFSILTIVSILISPVAWPHYLMQAALPTVVAIKHFQKTGLPGKAGLLLLFSCVTLFVPYYGIRIRFLSGVDSEPTHIVPFVFTLPALLPVIGLIAIIGILSRLDHLPESMCGPDLSLSSQEPSRERCAQVE